MYVLTRGHCNLEAKWTGLEYWIGDSEEVHRSYNMYPVNLLTHFRNPWYRVFPQQTCPWHPLDIEVDIEINVHVKKCVKQNRFMYQIPGCEWYKVKVSRHPSPCTNINTRDFMMKYCFHFLFEGRRVQQISESYNSFLNELLAFQEIF